MIAYSSHFCLVLSSNLDTKSLVVGTCRLALLTVDHEVLVQIALVIALAKKRYIFLISQRKHMLWLLIRSISLRHF